MRRVAPEPANRFCLAVLLGALAAPLAGCREELGPVTWPKTTVEGVVKVGTRSVTGGWIEFYPVAGTVGNLRVAPIGPDGRFSAEGVAVGTNLIGFAQLAGAGPYRYQFRSYQTQLRREIKAGVPTTLNLDLAEEAAAQAEARRNDGDPVHDDPPR
jgi:hypothetical protein